MEEERITTVIFTIGEDKVKHAIVGDNKIYNHELIGLLEVFKMELINEIRETKTGNEDK